MRWAARAALPRKWWRRRPTNVLALKGNQESLREDVEVFVAEQNAAGFKDTTISSD
jgi:hypothetical protein